MHTSKRKSNPTFLAITALDAQQTKDSLMSYIGQALNFLTCQQPNNKVLQELIQSYTKDYKLPQSIHITTLFLGGKQNSDQNAQLKEFEPGVELQVKIYALAIYPGNIMTGICRKEDYPIPIQNKYPHVTSLCGSWQPKQSNQLLESIFDKNPQLYQQVFQIQEDKYFEVRMDNNQTVYVVILKEPLSFMGVTKIY